MSAATFDCPDRARFRRHDELVLIVTGQLIELDQAVLACRDLETDLWCCGPGCEGEPRESVAL